MRAYVRSMMLPILLFLLVFFFLPTPLQAHRRTSESNPTAGTFFLLDLNMGTALFPNLESDRPDLAFGSTFGLGGTLPGTWLRGYFIMNYGYSPLALTQGSESLVRFDGAINTFTGGIRLLLPIMGPLRLFGDIGLGSSFASGEIEDGRGSLYQSPTEDYFTFMAALGLQFRFTRAFSIGAKAEFNFYSVDQNDFFYAETPSIYLDKSGVDTIRTLFTVTLHF